MRLEDLPSVRRELAQPGAVRSEVLRRHRELYNEGLRSLHEWKMEQLVVWRDALLASWARNPTPGMRLVDDVLPDGRRYAMLELDPDYDGPEPGRAEQEAIEREDARVLRVRL